jgi:hypothetical protein
MQMSGNATNQDLVGRTHELAWLNCVATKNHRITVYLPGKPFSPRPTSKCRIAVETDRCRSGRVVRPSLGV